MKKLLSALMAVILTFGAFSVLATAVETQATLGITTNTTSADVGDIITVNVELSENSKLGSLSFNLLYDTDELQYVEDSVTVHGIFSLEEIDTRTPGKIFYAAITGTSVTMGGSVLTVQFEVRKVNCELNLDITEAYDDNDEDVTFSLAERATNAKIVCAHGRTVEEITTEPTHTQTGTKSIVCETCGEVIKVESIPATGHTYGEWIEEKIPTCTEDGVEIRNCSCGETERRTVAALGHDDGTWSVSKDPTCAEEGIRELRCNRCGVLLDTETLPMGQHVYDIWTVVKNATCTENGMEESICSICGEKETRIISAFGHDGGEWMISTEPTCTTAGTEIQKCTVCGEVIGTREVAATDHSYDAWETVASPTCTDKGSEKHTCTVCGYTETRDVEPAGHVWEHTYTVDKEPTCTEDGSKSIHCTVCGVVKDSQVIPASGHRYTGEVIQEATCTESGLQHVVCSVCGDKVDEAIPAKGHDWGEWIVDQQATETEAGSRRRECAVCGAVETEVIPMVQPEEPDTENPVPETQPDTEAPETTETAGESYSGSSPDTGDSMIAPILSLGAAGAAAVVLLVKRRRK